MSLATETSSLWLEDLVNDQVGLRLRVRECMYSATTPFQRIAVYDSMALGRILTLGSAIALSDLDEAIWAEHLVHPALGSLPEARRILVLGGGDGGVCREILRYPAVEVVTVVEIDRQVVEVCKRFFPAAAAGLVDQRVELVIDDAHRFLRNRPEPYDLVIIDACELVNPASDAFNTLTFAQSVFSCLRPQGVLIAPLGCPIHQSDACRTTLSALKERFPDPAVYLVGLPSEPAGVLAVAWCGPRPSPTPVPGPTAVGPLRSWHRGLTGSLFQLPRHIHDRLGLPQG